MPKQKVYQDEQLELIIDNFKTINRKVKQELLPADTGYYCQNFRYDNLYGYLFKRPPRRKYNSSTLGTDPIKSSYRYYKNSTSTAYFIISKSSLLQVGNDSAGTFSNIQTGLTDGKRWKFITYKDLCYGFNGYDSNQVFDGTNVNTMGAPVPAAPSGVDSGGGTKPNGAYLYKVTYVIDGYQEGSASPSSAVINTAAHTVTLTIPTSTNTRVTARKIYRTAASGAVYYYVATVPNNTATTYADSTADADLDTTVQAPTDYGVPGSYRYPLLHKERVHIAYNSTYKSRIIFSDIRNGLSYPDVFPANNYLDIAKDDGDELKGIEDDPIGNYVVFKENSIRIINTDTDSPVGWTIGKPLTNLGCIAPYSIIKTPKGIVYVSRWGENKNRLMLWTGAGVKHIFEEIDPILDNCDLAAVKDIVCHYHDGKIHLSYTDRVEIGSVAVDSATKLLLHCNGTLGNTSFTDDELTAKTILNTGQYDTYTKLMLHMNDAGLTDSIAPLTNVVTLEGDTHLDTTTKKFGAGSALFDGTGDYMHVPHSADWDFGNGNFTIEFNIMWNSNSNTVALVQGEGTVAAPDNFAWGVYAYADNDLYFYYTTGGTNATGHSLSIGALVIDLNTWYHVMIVRNGADLLFFIDGVLVKTANIGADTIYNSSHQLEIGGFGHANSNYHNGWIDEVRISKGIARQTATFTMPVCEYGYVYIDTSNKKFGTGGANFSGTPYLSVADSADFKYGSGDFTVEMWVKFLSVPTSGFQTFYSKRATSAANMGLYIGIDDDNLTAFASSDGINFDILTGVYFGVISDTNWHHIMVVRSGNTFYGFLDGIATVLATSAATIQDDTSVLCIGSDTDAIAFTGYMDEIRISKGVARQVTNFTVPTIEYGYGYNNNELIMNLETMSNIVVDKKNIDSYCNWNAGLDLGELLTGTSDTTGFCYIEETDIDPTETTIEVQWHSGKHTFGNSRIRKRLYQVKIEFERAVTTGSLTFYYSLDGGAESSFNVDFATYAGLGNYIYQFPLGTYCFNIQERLFHNDDKEDFAIKRITYLYSLEPIISYL